MTTNEAREIVRVAGIKVVFFWEGLNLIRSVWDGVSQAWRETIVGDCCNGTREHAEHEAWLREAAAVAVHAG